MMKILKSLGLIGAVVAVAGGATYAYFSDTETSSGNTIAAGTLDLQMSGEGTVPFSVTDAYPGMPAVKRLVHVKNAGSINGHLQFTGATVSNDENGLKEPESSDGDSTDGASGGELCANLEVQVSFVGGASDVVLYPWGSLAALNPTGDALMPAAAERDLKVEFRVPGTVGNTIQSDICGINYGLKLVQDVNQDGTADEDGH
ncbi:MAG: hypothetical protein HGB18_00245 [Candidatus Moranbacteria bacterium]|nr:hypothetical protein [Candidatus Moranbacteria bacterium]